MVQKAEEDDYASRRGAENDPQPKLLMERDGKLSITFFDSSLFATEKGKDTVATAMLDAVNTFRAQKVAFAQPGWGLFGDESLAAGAGTGPTPKDHPDRQEIHVLIVLDRERVETYVAVVERVGAAKRGKLRPWNEELDIGGPLVDDVAAGNYVDSRFINPIKEALR